MKNRLRIKFQMCSSSSTPGPVCCPFVVQLTFIRVPLYSPDQVPYQEAAAHMSCDCVVTAGSHRELRTRSCCIISGMAARSLESQHSCRERERNKARIIYYTLYMIRGHKTTLYGVLYIRNTSRLMHLSDRSITWQRHNA